MVRLTEQDRHGAESLRDQLVEILQTPPRAGNRRINRVLHTMAIVQLRGGTPGRGHYRRRLAEGKTTMDSVRALKRHLADIV